MSPRKLFNISSSYSAVSPLPSETQQGPPSSRESAPPDDLPEIHKKKKLKVIFAGAHVDDWILCGGTIARYTALGHEVHIISMTPGNSISMADVAHTTVEELAAARREQAERFHPAWLARQPPMVKGARNGVWVQVRRGFHPHAHSGHHAGKKPVSQLVVLGRSATRRRLIEQGSAWR